MHSTLAHHSFKPIEVVANCHGQRQKLFQRLPRFLKLYGDATPLERDSFGQVFQNLGHDCYWCLHQKLRSFESLPAELGQGFTNLPAPPPLKISRVTFGQTEEMSNQRLTIGQPAAADMLANTRSHDLLRPPPAHTE